MAKSILQTRRECYICRRRYNLVTVRGLEEHHIFGGSGRRSLSEKYGLKVYLCHRHHNEPPLGVHYDSQLMRLLQAEGQRAFERDHSREEFVCLFGKNCLGGNENDF